MGLSIFFSKDVPLLRTRQGPHAFLFECLEAVWMQLDWTRERAKWVRGLRKKWIRLSED